MTELIKNLRSVLIEFPGTDIYYLCGKIVNQSQTLYSNYKRSHSKKAFLIIDTIGGNADEAYKIARFFQRKYESFTLFADSYCKSAGTLIALGADEIIMGDRGEFGPLDVQRTKQDDLMGAVSGLNLEKTLDTIIYKTKSAFEFYLDSIVKNSGGIIKTTTAAKMAIDLSLGLFSKFTEQIDPNELGENQRSIDIATKYFDRLNIKKLYNQDVISKLIYDYPSHSFVIDREEAQQIFKNVREPNEYEYILESYLKAVNQDYNVPQVYNINELVKEGSKNEQNITTDHEHQTVDGTGTESNLSTGKIISGKEGEAPTKSASKKVKLVPAS